MNHSRGYLDTQDIQKNVNAQSNAKTSTQWCTHTPSKGN